MCFGYMEEAFGLKCLDWWLTVWQFPITEFYKCILILEGAYIIGVYS
jgi:hypothetical protein